MKIILDKKPKVLYYHDTFSGCDVIYFPKYNIEFYQRGSKWRVMNHLKLTTYFTPYNKPLPKQIELAGDISTNIKASDIIQAKADLRKLGCLVKI